MIKYNGMKAEISKGAEVLPVGGYVCKIMDAKIEERDWGNQLVVSIDIAEGDHMDFYANNYRNQQSEDKRWKGVMRLTIPSGDGSDKDEWNKRSLNNFIGVLEDANMNFRFDGDEAKLKGKKIGVLFRNEEWAVNGKTGWSVRPFRAAPVGDILDGKDFKIKDKPLPENKRPKASEHEWVSAASNTSAVDELPF